MLVVVVAGVVAVVVVAGGGGVVVVFVIREAAEGRKNALHCLVMRQKLLRLYGITVWDLRPLLSCC